MNEQAIYVPVLPNFETLRKLAAYSVRMGTENMTQAVIHADKAVFEKDREYAVGQGLCTAEEAVDAIVDRGVVHIMPVIRTVVKKGVHVACKTMGTFIGGLFGPHGAVIGRTIGIGVAKVVNHVVIPVIEKGVKKVAEVAKSIGRKIVDAGKKAFSAIKNFFFG